jgi:hypothetical protein
MANTFEKNGFPTVVITALDSIATMMGVPRFVPGVRIPHPCSDPTLGNGEQAQRLELVAGAVKKLETS